MRRKQVAAESLDEPRVVVEAHGADAVRELSAQGVGVAERPGRVVEEDDVGLDGDDGIGPWGREQGNRGVQVAVCEDIVRVGETHPRRLHQRQAGVASLGRPGVDLRHQAAGAWVDIEPGGEGVAGAICRAVVDKNEAPPARARLLGSRATPGSQAGSERRCNRAPRR
nr:hypothetical protein [Demequina litorisediminis]